MSRISIVCVPAASSARRHRRSRAFNRSMANGCEITSPARAASQSGPAALANASISSGGSAKNSVSSSNAATGFCGRAHSASVSSMRFSSPMFPTPTAATARLKRPPHGASAPPVRSVKRQSAARTAPLSNGSVDSGCASPPIPSLSQRENNSSKQVFISPRFKAKRASIRRMR